MFCKTIQSKYTPVVMKSTRNWFGYYLISGKLHHIDLGTEPKNADEAKMELNKFLVWSSASWIAAFDRPYCENCKFSKTYYLNNVNIIVCSMCKTSFG